MADRLSIYNNALIKLGSRKLQSLSENRKSRRVLDGIWDSGFLKRIIETGQFNSSIRSMKSVYDTDVSTDDFGGYKYAHKKPSDWVRTLSFSTDPYFSSDLHMYEDEQNYWYCDFDEVYIKIVSDDAKYGGDISLWSESLVAFAEAELALRACKSITSSDTIVSKLEREVEKLMRKAKGRDAMNQPTKFNPIGSWASARLGSRGGRNRGYRR